MGGSLYDTPFILQKEEGNKFRVQPVIEKVGDNGHIPFLRSQVETSDFNKMQTSSMRG